MINDYKGFLFLFSPSSFAFRSFPLFLDVYTQPTMVDGVCLGGLASSILCFNCLVLRTVYLLEGIQDGLRGSFGFCYASGWVATTTAMPCIDI